jgi:hypothetical protein
VGCAADRLLSLAGHHEDFGGHQTAGGHAVAAETSNVNVVPHPLSYRPIQHAAFSDEPPLIDVGFKRRYDLFCVLLLGDPEQSWWLDRNTEDMRFPVVYRNCRIVGVTDQQGLRSNKSLWGSSSGPRQVLDLFDGMLVLETQDGRLAYIRKSAVKYIEETAVVTRDARPSTLN